MTRNLTPYDTGQRAEPHIWPVPESLSTVARVLDESRFGKVDFEDEEGVTIATIWVERNERGHYIVHVSHDGDVGLMVHRG